MSRKEPNPWPLENGATRPFPPPAPPRPRPPESRILFESATPEISGLDAENAILRAQVAALEAKLDQAMTDCAARTGEQMIQQAEIEKVRAENKQLRALATTLINEAKLWSSFAGPPLRKAVDAAEIELAKLPEDL